MSQPRVNTPLAYVPPDKTSLSSRLCSRFLRARRFDPTKAQKQFAEAEAWRSKHAVDELFASFPTEEFESAKCFYPRWTGRRDKVCA